MIPRKIATTFGGSAFRLGDGTYEDGVRLGWALAKSGYTVRCGGYYGLMEAVAAGVREAGGSCVGITVGSFDPKPANEHIAREQKEADIYDRLRALIEGADLFVVQEGALGTLAELALVWCLRYTETLRDVRICVIGECWTPVLDGLRRLPIAGEHFDHVEAFASLEHFIASVLGGGIVPRP